MRRTISIICLAGVLAISSCSAGSDSGLLQLTESELNDLQMVLDDLEEAVPATMDLADEVQFRFLTRQLQSAGLTSDNSPKLFTALDASRKSPSPVNNSNGLTDPNDLPTFSITKIETSDGINFTATGQAYLPYSLHTLVLSLQLYDELTERIIAVATQAKYDYGGTITISANGQTDSAVPPGRKITALLTWTYLSPGDGTTSCGVVRSTMTYQP